MLPRRALFLANASWWISISLLEGATASRFTVTRAVETLSLSSTVFFTHIHTLSLSFAFPTFIWLAARTAVV